MTTPAELAALRQRLSDTLMSAACGGIAFTIPAFAINPGGYVVIGISLGVPHGSPPRGARDRPMGVRVDSHLPRHVGASYHADVNEIVVPRADYGATPNERMSVVHEATHAIFDYYRSPIHAWHEEAASYIAGALYLRRAGAPPVGHGIFAAAEAIAAHIAAPQRIGGPLNGDVTQAQLDGLVAVIRASPTYRGLRRERRRYRYPHDGGGI